MTLFVNYDFALPQIAVLKQAANGRFPADPPNFLVHPTLLSLSCALTI
jgi:hypothetical protein